jgi:6-phosphogluconate dehydrogenase
LPDGRRRCGGGETARTGFPDAGAGLTFRHRRRRRGERPAPAEQGYLHCGPAGAGHFVKMVHNGIEYGLMQAYAEGFDILQERRQRDPAER